MTGNDRIQLAVLTALVGTGLGLLGGSVTGMAALDDRLHAAAVRAQQEERRLHMLEVRRDCERYDSASGSGEQL